MTGPRSLRRRLALAFALFVAGVLLLAGTLVERSVAAHFDELDEHELAVKVALIRSQLARGLPDVPAASAGTRLDEALSGHATVAVVVRDAGAADNVFYARHAEVFDAVATKLAARAGEPVKWSHEGQRFIGYQVALEVPGVPGRDGVAWVALDISHHVGFLRAIRMSLALGILLAAVFAAALAAYVAHRGLAPLRRMTDTARGLSAERLGERLSVADAPSEVRELVEAFNSMLDRLEAAFGRLNDYSADIAHELRTPVSNLMTETEVALSRVRDAAAYRETLHSNLEEFERLARMIADMLFLAQAEHRNLPRSGERIALEDEARALIEFYEALAEEGGVRIVAEGAAHVVGDRLMLRRALSNLLSNALRHAERGSVVRIAIDTESGGVRLAVSNRGVTIPPAQLARVFERFHRVDTASGRKGEGAGLGLAITRSIVSAHHGRIEACSENGVTTFSIYLPAPERPEAG